ncbi:proline-, glutamic acid- and leucine-rich protein 1-like [Spodoptera litura]|uniref:Proline-, glutamic acid- and leucine-rich protein 1-like n=1 Tax=Spodoptera litura TaxID=69820 RepID=A0A9J7J0P4_SPOLT|nr:proline-, glutamic acid- and leucine-rich protein 1-like [Spodoptera litura]
MSQILQKLRNVDPNDSDAVKEAITSFIQNLLKHVDNNSNVWLRVLEDVLTRYPRYCSQHRPTIEKFIVHFLESSNYYNVIIAAKCAHALQQIRPSQDKLASPKNCWREQMSILCNSAHTLIEAIFSNTINIYKNNHSVKKKDVELLGNSALTVALSNILNIKKTHGSSSEEKKMVLCNKLRNVFVFIQAMLVEVYPVAKPVQPQVILEVIVQALSVSSSVSTDAVEASTVKTQALRTLDALILCLGSNLIPFSGLVFRFVMQTLKWSSENPSEHSRKVRITAYNSLSKWLGILHAHRVSSEGRARSWEDDLTKHIIQDITPPKKIVQLTMSNQYTKNLSKKAKRKLANTMLQQSTISSHMPGEKNKADVSEESSDEVANAALDCAETFLTVCGIFLKPTTHKIFQERLVRECFNLESYSEQRAMSLLRALDAARANSPGSVPPPTQYCLQLYSVLVNNPCDQIRKFSSQALLNIRLHLHCSPPSINFAIDAPAESKAPKNKKEISKKNREALEALLGKERMPPTSSTEDSTEAPATKKPRLDDDRISISSESAASVVISDATDDEIEEINEEQIDVEEEIQIFTEQDDAQDQSSEKSKQTSDTPCMTVDNSPEPNNDEIIVPNQTNSIYDAKTQVPLNTSHDTIDGDKSPSSLEIVYDAPNSSSKVAMIEKMDDDNLPSTNETDDVQITCGQAILGSQGSTTSNNAINNIEIEVEISTTSATNEATKSDETVELKENDNEAANKNIEVTITNKEVTIEDMLADFVDEVNDEPSVVV